MGLRLSRPEGILPGVTLNVSKSGPSLSFGERGTHVTVGASGVRETVGLPGIGIFYTERQGWRELVPFGQSAFALA